MIIVLGSVHVLPTDRGEFMADIAAIDPGKIAGSGCQFYSVTQDSSEAGRLVVAERWQDQASLTAHLQRSTTIAFGQKWAKRMRSEVLKYDALNARPLMD